MAARYFLVSTTDKLPADKGAYDMGGHTVSLPRVGELLVKWVSGEDPVASSRGLVPVQELTEAQYLSKGGA